MDSESLAQVERIVTAATKGIRQDIAALRESQETMATALRDEIAATAGALRQEIAASAEETKRHTGVLIESLRRDVQSIAEGFQMHLDRRHAEDRDYMNREFREMHALLKLSYAQLHERVEDLDRRVNRIEHRLGLSE